VIVSAHQPAYLPWLGLLHKAALSDVFVLVDNVQFEKDSYINRNRLRSPEGWRWLTVPVASKGHLAATIEHLRVMQGPWQRKHWTAFKMFYAKTPYFKGHGSFLERTYQRKWEFLVDLCEDMLRYLFEAFEIRPKLLRASTLGIEGYKTDYVLELCRKTDASTFVFGALGRNYADVERFKKEGIRAVFQDYCHPTYPQAYSGFEQGMNAFDLLMNVGPRSREVLMSGNLTREAMQ